MRNIQLSPKELKVIREGLPQGAQTQIAKRHNVRPQDVNKILHGIKIRYGKCNEGEVLNDAILIFNEANEPKKRAKEAIEAMSVK